MTSLSKSQGYFVPRKRFCGLQKRNLVGTQLWDMRCLLWSLECISQSRIGSHVRDLTLERIILFFYLGVSMLRKFFMLHPWIDKGCCWLLSSDMQYCVRICFTALMERCVWALHYIPPISIVLFTPYQTLISWRYRIISFYVVKLCTNKASIPIFYKLFSMLISQSMHFHKERCNLMTVDCLKGQNIVIFILSEQNE